MRTMLAAALLFCVGSASAVTFNPSTGAGSASNAEVQAGGGWSANQYIPKNIEFCGIQADYYAITVQFVNSQGMLVNQAITVEVRTHKSVRKSLTAGGFDFTGYGPPTALGTPPTVGGTHAFRDNTGRLVVGTITSAALSSTKVSVVSFNGSYGYGTVVP